MIRRGDAGYEARGRALVAAGSVRRPELIARARSPDEAKAVVAARAEGLGLTTSGPTTALEAHGLGFPAGVLLGGLNVF